MREEGFVSLCSVDKCIYNSENQCHADSIEVAIHTDHADCETFTAE